jgi:signal transduction histidine kinase
MCCVGSWADAARRVAGHRLALATTGAVLGAVTLVQALPTETGPGTNPRYTLVVCLLALLTAVPLALPATAGALTISAATALSLAPFHSLTAPGQAAALIAASIAAYRISTPWVAVLVSVPFVLIGLVRPGAGTVLFASLVPTLAWAGVARAAQAQARTLEAARRAIAGSLVEHTARGERARIARELHDVVAHHISMIAVQAETARLATPGLPPAGAQRLTEIGDTARAGLTEMRRLLGVLREDAVPEGEPADAVPDRRPQPGLRELNELLDDARATGGGVRLILRGAPAALDPGVELAAYRIVQEALTNARRHAPGAAVDVELRYTADALRVRIRDNGPGPPSAVDGHGLHGMRERAAAVGGSLHTGRASSGGFLVEAALPVKSEEAR